MSPRSYNLRKRRQISDETRARILEAARELLTEENDPAQFSMEAIARRADVARLTIYYQFGSRPGLLEALYDQMANRGNMRQMSEVFQEPDAKKALEKMVRIFVGFWASDPIAIRRVRGMAALDAEIGAGIRARDARRRHIAEEILKRFHLQQLDPKMAQKQHFAADVLSTLTSFETYDALAREGHGEEAIIEVLLRLTRNVIRLE